MSHHLAALLVTLITLTVTMAHAQTPMRVRGTITAVDGNVLSVKNRDGRDLKVGSGLASSLLLPSRGRHSRDAAVHGNGIAAVKPLDHHVEIRCHGSVPASV